MPVKKTATKTATKKTETKKVPFPKKVSKKPVKKNDDWYVDNDDLGAECMPVIHSDRDSFNLEGKRLNTMYLRVSWLYFKLFIKSIFVKS